MRLVRSSSFVVFLDSDSVFGSAMLNNPLSYFKVDITLVCMIEKKISRFSCQILKPVVK